MGAWIKRLMSSRKVVLALAGLALPILNGKLGLNLTEDQIADGMLLIGSVIIGIAYEDGQKKSANGASPTAGGGNSG